MKDVTTIIRRWPRAPRSAWDWFPWAITLALVVVIAINGGMVWIAVNTFPGVAGTDGYDLSNDYNRVLTAEARQKALGWQLRARLDPANHTVVRLVDRTGAPLPGARLTATAERPIGPKDTRTLAFQEVAPGRYIATKTLPMGRWDVLVDARADGHLFTSTAQVVAEQRVGR